MPKKATWPRGPHTEGKHDVLQNYLHAWLPILGSWAGRIVFIDGFAGPGEYEGGEEGSPIIALKALIEHSRKHAITAEVVFLFIEADEDRAEHLKQLIDVLRPHFPPKVKAEVVTGKFDGEMTAVLDDLDEQRSKMAPAFVMVDPFGISGTPMDVIRRILRNPRCEVYVSFMYESMNRFIGTPEFEPHLDALFGTGAWREAITLLGPERQRFLYDLYATQLKEAGARYVVHFDLYRENRLIYGIFFGTQHLVGCDRMKESIWKVAPSGDYSFRGGAGVQLDLGMNQPDFGALKVSLCGEFGSEGLVPIEEVISFVQSDRIPFYSGQLRKHGLKPMESVGQVVADEASRKRKGTYPPGTRIRFVC
jgi:three-Cys-motif partner protein